MRIETQKRLINPFGKGFAIGENGVLLSDLRLYTVTANFASATTGVTVGVDVTCSGVAIGDVVVGVGAVTLDIGDDVTIRGTVTAANTVRLTLSNDTAGTVDLASSDFRVIVAQLQADK